MRFLWLINGRDVAKTYIGLILTDVLLLLETINNRCIKSLFKKSYCLFFQDFVSDFSYISSRVIQAASEVISGAVGVQVFYSIMESLV